MKRRQRKAKTITVRKRLQKYLHNIALRYILIYVISYLSIAIKWQIKYMMHEMRMITMHKNDEIYNGMYGYNVVSPFPAHCYLRVFKQKKQAVVIVSQSPDNKGKSITNASERLASKIVREFRLNPQQTTFFEHYPFDYSSHSAGKPSCEKVTFTWHGKEASDPVWHDVNERPYEDFMIIKYGFMNKLHLNRYTI